MTGTAALFHRDGFIIVVDPYNKEHVFRVWEQIGHQQTGFAPRDRSFENGLAEE